MTSSVATDVERNEGLEGIAMHDAVIVSAVRTAVGKAPKGTLSVMRPDDMARWSFAKRSTAHRARRPRMSTT